MVRKRPQPSPASPPKEPVSPALETGLGPVMSSDHWDITNVTQAKAGKVTLRQARPCPAGTFPPSREQAQAGMVTVHTGELTICFTTVLEYRFGVCHPPTWEAQRIRAPGLPPSRGRPWFSLPGEPPAQASFQGPRTASPQGRGRSQGLRLRGTAHPGSHAFSLVLPGVFVCSPLGLSLAFSEDTSPCPLTPLDHTVSILGGFSVHTQPPSALSPQLPTRPPLPQAAQLQGSLLWEPPVPAVAHRPLYPVLCPKTISQPLALHPPASPDPGPWL